LAGHRLRCARASGNACRRLRTDGATNDRQASGRAPVLSRLSKCAFFLGFSNVFWSVLSTTPPKDSFVEKLDRDRTKDHDEAREERRESRSIIAVHGGGSFIGAALTKLRVIGATMWRDPFLLPRNIFHGTQNGRSKTAFCAAARKFSLTACAASV